MIWAWLFFIPFAILCYVQNMAFTWSSRSRQGDDFSDHRHASWASNGVYIIGQVTQTIVIVKFMDSIPWLITMMVIYTLVCSEGSVAMMKRMHAKHEAAVESTAAEVKVESGD